MKMIFRGWKREVKEHEHAVRKVVKHSDGNYSQLGVVPLEWCDDARVYGRVENLALTGNFLVEIEFHEKELKSWLTRYVASKPEASIKLLAEMQAEAILELSHKNQRPTISSAY